MANGSDYIWLLNNDAAVPPDALRILVTAAEREPKAGMTAPPLRFHERPDLIAGGVGSFDLIDPDLIILNKR